MWVFGLIGDNRWCVDVVAGGWCRSVTMTISDMMSVLFRAMFCLVDFEFRSVMFWLPVVWN
ncbi:hypothetical protein Hanom_Chr03g00266991 [Helianthus anomalus]